ncbi:ABC transporter ATP-binding protein/permease [Amylibacter sp.]|nr:ABC transporter ATP-binding protein/permease [Amylibacter sp.]
MNIIQKSYRLLGSDRRQVPWMVILFIVISGVDVLGVGLIGPFISLVMDASLQASLAQFLGNILDKSIDEQTAMLIIGVSLMFFFFLRFFLAIGTNAAVVSFSEKQRMRLKMQLLKTYQSMSSQTSNKRNTAEYIQSVHTLTGHYSSIVLFFMLKFVSESIICIFLICLLAYQNLTLVFVMITLLLVGTVGWDRFSRTGLKYMGEAINRYSGEALNFLRENLDGYEEIRVLGKAEGFLNRFEDNTVKLSKLQKLTAIYNSIPRYLLDLIILLFIVFLGTFSFLFTSNFGDFIPVMAVFAVAGVRLMPSATLMAHAVVCIRHNSNSVDVLYGDYVQGLRLECERKDNKDTVVIEKFKELEIQGLKYAYDTQNVNVLENVNLKIKAGDSIGIVGQSGSGKSTLANLILGLLDPDEGSILINGNYISDCIVSWQTQVAVIPQHIFLLDATIETNVSLEFDVGKIDKIKLETALRMAAIKDFVDTLPLGVTTEIGEKGAFLSGGQRQRLILARAFYHGRDFLIMDEATSALDTNTEGKIVNEIMSLKNKVTMIVIAHRFSTIKHCDHIFEIKDGQVTQQKG